MNIRDLRYFVAVANHCHFGKAAEACHVSQPTLSGQVKKLEEALGITLFERSNRSVSLTAAGERILTHARALLEQAEEIEAAAETLRDPTAGGFRLGVIPTLSPYLMPRLLTPLRRACPKLHLSLFEETTDRLLDRLQRFELDAALIASTVTCQGLTETPLFQERFWCAFPPTHRLARLNRIGVEDLDPTEMLLLSDGHCLRDQTLEVCRRDRASTMVGRNDLSASSLDTLVHLVIAGYGVTMLPALAVPNFEHLADGLVIRPIDDPEASRGIRLVVRRNFHRAAVVAAIVELCREPVRRPRSSAADGWAISDRVGVDVG